MFFLLYKRADDAVYDDFPKISEHIRTFFKDCPRLPEMTEEDPKMFQSYTGQQI